jgi:hypothetical protein
MISIILFVKPIFIKLIFVKSMLYPKKQDIVLIVEKSFPLETVAVYVENVLLS